MKRPYYTSNNSNDTDMDADSNFKKSIKVVFNNEGGYSNHPDDTGGATMMGITQKTLNSAYSNGIINHNRLNDLTNKDAERIYYHMYWLASHANTMSYPLCLLYLDASVHHGITGAIRLLQKTINKILDGSVLNVDGIMGPITTKYVKMCTSNMDNTKRFCMVFLDVRDDQFDRLVESRPSNKSFIVGWKNRTRRLRNLVDAV